MWRRWIKCPRHITLPSMATRLNKKRLRARRGLGDWGVLLIFAFAVAIVLLLPTLRDVWRRSDERAARSLSMEKARETNDSIPFVPGRGRAMPVRFHGSAASREQAVQCLADAAVYEAGDDEGGQKAVMQVVLNRVSRPGFPKTVCGVVYQGASGPTGCQFSFACDGSQIRRPEQAGWLEARTAARRALSGRLCAGWDGNALPC
jgi:hypothetical protein